MSTRCLLVLALGVGFVGVPSARADDKPKDAKKPQPSGEPAKPIVIQIDASKLPPEVLKHLMQLAEKPGTKPTAEPTKPAAKPVKAISLAEAIAIVEKATKATAIKAEREEDEGKVEFEVVVATKEGKVEYALDATGTILKKEFKGEKGEKGQKGDGEENKGKKKP